MKSQDKSTISGFTLLELSIVLVIIGLIVGGVLTGRDLIEAARIRSTVSQIEKYKTAVNAFRLKYNVTPGDLGTAEATAFNLLPISRAVNTDHNNGSICGTNANSSCSESFLFWQDLSSAGLVEGGFTSADDSTSAPPAIPLLPLYLPKGKLRDNVYWMVFYTYAMTNTFSISTISAGGYANGGLSPLQAYSMDVKMDDGLPNSGSVLNSGDSTSGNYFGIMDASNASCVVDVSGVYQYILNSTPTNALGCYINIRAGF